MTDLNKIIADIELAIEAETHPRVAFYLNAAASHIANAQQLKDLNRHHDIDIERLGLANDRVNHGRRSSDRPTVEIFPK